VFTWAFAIATFPFGMPVHNGRIGEIATKDQTAQSLKLSAGRKHFCRFGRAHFTKRLEYSTSACPTIPAIKLAKQAAIQTGFFHTLLCNWYRDLADPCVMHSSFATARPNFTPLGVLGTSQENAHFGSTE
jgi:hypothetical protein